MGQQHEQGEGEPVAQNPGRDPAGHAQADAGIGEQHQGDRERQHGELGPAAPARHRHPVLLRRIHRRAQRPGTRLITWLARGGHHAHGAVPVPAAALGAGQSAGMVGAVPVGLGGGVAVTLPALFRTGAAVVWWYFFL